MDIVVIDYRLCAFTYSFHARKPFMNVFTKLSQLLLANKVKPAKIIFAVDTGPSKRREIYPEYKLHRAKIEKKKTPEEQSRRKQFEYEYKQSIKWLSHLGTVIDIDKIEADDIASIIANRYAGDLGVSVTLVSSDKDWASFLVDSNIRLLHVDREKFITDNTCVSEFELDPKGIFWCQVFAGSDKENVKGITKFGIKTFLKHYNEEKDFDKLYERIYEEVVVKSYRGATLPIGISYDDMVDMNYTLFSPVTFDDLTSEEQVEFLEKFQQKAGGSYDNLILDLMTNYSQQLMLSPSERSIFKLN